MNSLNFKLNRFQGLIILLLILGICFRWINLDHKIYWHDEVYTSLRAAGYTQQEIFQNAFNNQLRSPRDLQKFQTLKPKSQAIDTIHSLATEDPQHPPFYFLMARFWMQGFGSSPIASRSLPILISLFSLPFMYQLGLELFNSKLTATLATILLALSPVDILFSQLARQYSLLTLITITSSLFLVRALRMSNGKTWSLYTLNCAIGLYTHSFFVLALVSQGVFVLLESLRSRCAQCQRQSRETRRKINAYILAILATTILYSPWLLVLLNNYQRALETTNWTKDQFNLLYLLKLWILSFTSLFIDLDLGFNNLWNYLLRLPFLILIFVALYTIYRHTSLFTFLFLLTSITVPFLLLAVPDLLFSNQRSAVTRYLIACFPGIQLAVAYFLATKLMQYKAIAYLIFAALLTASIVSCSLNAVSETSWSKVPSYFNGEIARRINSSVPVIVLSDRGDDFTNMGDLISLSYFLNDRVKLFLLSYPSHRENLNNILERKQTNFLVFRPSNPLKTVLEKEKKILEPFFLEGNLWRLTNN